MSERTLQAHADPLLGHTELRGVGFVVFAHDYAGIVREDHRLFVEAFPEGRIPGISST